MTESATIQSATVIIHSHRTVNDFIVAVFIHVSYAQTVVALSTVGFIAFLSRVETPLPG